jgi:hypothetical protein
MVVRLGDVLWWLGWVLGGAAWIALLGLAHSAGPIDEAVFLGQPHRCAANRLRIPMPLHPVGQDRGHSRYRP